ncbi:MAG: hypothetical protein U0610_20285 [bacterium]
MPAPHPDVVARADERRRTDQLLAEERSGSFEMSWDAAIVTLRKARSRVDDPSEINAEIAAIEAKRNSRETASRSRRRGAPKEPHAPRPVLARKASEAAEEKQQRKLEDYARPRQRLS